MVIGHQVGSTEPGEVPSGNGGRMIHKHDVASFETWWKEVGKNTGSRWDVRAWLEEEGKEGKKWDDPETRRLVFEVERVG